MISHMSNLSAMWCSGNRTLFLSIDFLSFRSDVIFSQSKIAHRWNIYSQSINRRVFSLKPLTQYVNIHFCFLACASPLTLFRHCRDSDCDWCELGSMQANMFTFQGSSNVSSSASPTWLLSFTAPACDCARLHKLQPLSTEPLTVWGYLMIY